MFYRGTMTAADPAADDTSLVGQVVARVRAAAGELSKFGLVGLAGLVIDVTLFNVLLQMFDVGPLSSKAVATTTAATASYFMNRHWTWKDRARTGVGREYRLFIVLSAIGLGIVEGCLLTSHYLLGLDTPLWDNLSANGVGLVLGTAWRFWSFKKWVFLPVEDEPTADDDAGHAAAV